MVLRRAAYLALLPLVVVLPTWLLIARGVVAADGATDVLATIVVSFVLFVVLGVGAALVVARRSSRLARATSWADAAVLLGVTVALAAAGVTTSPFAVVPAVLLVLAWFWLALYEFVAEARARVRAFVDGVDPRVRDAMRRRPDADVYVIRPPSP
ncbi:hypothetical protein QT381_07790 [Galbitalea sp. SE-J8]|uniref:hypothetical protein n=1 Tax=Galbitalea sp. SE-J8 TaxID=3054952 RepID=UPI00259D2701|nr:hypothetical protein [Galbitalea sp. SE-J8]MDM4762905.1 hypothetical protein [Galbitalea sp. SE-J8]